MKSKYKFIRINEKYGDGYGKWYFKPSTIEQILEHWYRYCCVEIAEGMKEVADNLLRKSKNQFTQHYTTYYGSLVNMMSEAKCKSVWEIASELERELLQSRLTELDENTYFTNGLTKFIFVDNIYEITDEIDSDELVYPDEKNLNIKDVRFIQWPDGKHWYAKIGKIDIVDEQGNQKWNTKE